MSSIGTIPTALRGSVEVYGDPLLLKLVARVMLGPIADNQTVFIHPMGFAAWWGMLATALNLFPIGQLDGGHITYALFGRRSTAITLAAVGVLVALAIFVSRSWVVWTVVTVGMLASFGPHHPRVFDEDVPLDRGRKWLAVFALVMFVLCFTPTPIDLAGALGG
jgi:membrane-associated protease RseP (regulator of RpoE activity)